jgi:hypothetical protein
LNWTITTLAGDQIAAAGPAPVKDELVTIATMIVDPECWSPDKPRLLWAECILANNDKPIDIVRVRFGITRAEFRSDEGFFLDGTRVDLHGCNRHESIPGLGNALPDELHRADAQLLKDYGCNFVRLSHYPQHPAFLDACDELGILVYAEIATWKSVSSNRHWRRAARRQMRDLILRDRHHPSILVWGMGNESRSRIAYLELSELANELDPARPVTYAENHHYRARREKTTGIPDVWSVNYELEALEEARDACVLRNVIVSECCNYPQSVRGDTGAELTQVATLEYEWKIMADRPYVAGHAVWCFTDYATEHRKRVRRQAGLFDAWRQPKMAAELFRSRYSDDPFISLFVAGSGQKRTLHVFTNLHRLLLTRDDASPIELANNLHHVVDLEGSFARLHVEGTRGNVTVYDELLAWGKAETVAIAVEDNPLPGRIIAADFAIFDASGTPVCDWNGSVMATVEGDGRLLSFNDAGEVLVSRGTGRVYVEIGRSGEPFVIHATADALEPVTIAVTPSARGATDV